MVVAWATLGAEGAGPRGGGTSPYQGEDEHVRRYMYLLDTQYDSRWSFLQRVPSHVSYEPVRVPSLWMRSAGGAAPRGSGTGRS